MEIKMDCCFAKIRVKTASAVFTGIFAGQFKNSAMCRQCIISRYGNMTQQPLIHGRKSELKTESLCRIICPDAKGLI